MPHTHLLDTLALAELELAHFSALRTTPGPESAIERARNADFEWLVDPSRPGHAYVNRAVARHAGRLEPSALDNLPPAIAALELRPTELQPALVERLLTLGFKPAASLCYLAIRPPLLPIPFPLPPEHSVTLLAPAELDAFFDLLESTGTPFPPARRQAKRAHYAHDAFQIHIARNAEGEAVGWATLYRGRDFAFLGNAWTQPAHRGQGVHAALLAARLNAAAQARVFHVFTDVQHGSQSHANCERAGLRTVTVNTIWERPG